MLFIRGGMKGLDPLAIDNLSHASLSTLTNRRCSSGGPWLHQVLEGVCRLLAIHIISDPINSANHLPRGSLKDD